MNNFWRVIFTILIVFADFRLLDAEFWVANQPSDFLVFGGILAYAVLVFISYHLLLKIWKRKEVKNEKV
jgi:hypothetical protein